MLWNQIYFIMIKQNYTYHIYISYNQKICVCNILTYYVYIKHISVIKWILWDNFMMSSCLTNEFQTCIFCISISGIISGIYHNVSVSVQELYDMSIVYII